MNLREVTIGRSTNCDIYLDQRCIYASNMHGTIYYDGNQLMFKDTSSNGTLVNNIMVKKRTVPIHRGDSIMIAGKYSINWNQIDSFFPPQTLSRNSHPIGLSGTSPVGMPMTGAEVPNLSKWSWGAFSLSWIWGFFNGCWWMFLVKVGTFLMSVLLFWIPFASLFVFVIDFGLSVLFGVKGTEWAWNNRTWESVTSFNNVQKTWNTVGLILFILGILLFVFSNFFFFAAIMKLAH